MDIDDNFVSAAIVTYNNKEQAPQACRSVLENTAERAVRLYVIDNNSSDGTVQALEKLDGLTLLRQSKNLGFGAAHNKVLGEALGRYHFVINPDISFSEDVLSEMADFMDQNPDIVLCCPKILNPDGSEQRLTCRRPTFKRLFLGRLAPLGAPFRRIRDEYTSRDGDGVCDLDFCTGCFFVIRSEVFRRLGGFDERYFMYLEDADLTLRAKDFGRTVIAPQFSVTHEWNRESAKKPRYFFIHLMSCFKFLYKWRKHK